MKKIAFAACTAMIMIACTDDTSTPAQNETPGADSTAVEEPAMVDTSVPEEHYQPENLDKTTVIRKSREAHIKNMTPSELSELFGLPITGSETDLYSGTYGNGLSKAGEQPHGPFTFTTQAPKSKSGTWHLYRYDGEMSYGKPAGEWKVVYMDYVNGKPQKNLIVTIPFKNEECGMVNVKGQAHPEIALSDLEIDTKGTCSVDDAVADAAAQAEARHQAILDKKNKKTAK